MTSKPVRASPSLYVLQVMDAHQTPRLTVNHPEALVCEVCGGEAGGVKGVWGVWGEEEGVGERRGV